MNGLAVLLMGAVMFFCFIWFQKILKKDYSRFKTLNHTNANPHQAEGIIRSFGNISAFSFLLFIFSTTVSFFILTIAIKPPPAMIETSYFLGFIPYSTVSASFQSVWSNLAFALGLSISLPFITLAICGFGLVLPRTIPPSYIAMLLILGSLVYASAYIFDGSVMHKQPSFIPPILALPEWISKAYNACTSIIKVNFFCIALILKTYLGPVFTGYIISVEVYHFLVHGVVKPVPLLSSILDWVFEGLPHWVSSIYLITQVIYNIISNGIEVADG